MTTRTEFTLYGNVNDTNSLAEAAVTISAEGINDIVLERPAADQSTDNMILITGDNASQLGVSFMHIGEYRWTKTFAVGSDNQNEANYIPDGTYIFTITATDAANKTKVVQRTVTVDTAKPTIQAVSEAEYLPTTDDTERTSFMFRGNASDGEKSSNTAEIHFTEQATGQQITFGAYDTLGNKNEIYLTYELKKDGATLVSSEGISVNSSTGAWSLALPEEDGTYEYTFTAESVGFTNTKQRTVIRDTTPPTVTIASLTQNNNGTVVTVSGNASDELSGFDTSSGHTKFEYCFKQAGSAPAESDWQTKTDLSFYNWRFDIPSSGKKVRLTGNFLDNLYYDLNFL